MIVARLPPDSLTGAVASVVHNAAFNSFVSTGFVNSRWETVIFSGDPAVDKAEDFFPVIKYLYPPDFDAHDAEVLNDAVAVGIDIYAETGLNLVQIGEQIAQRWIRKGVMIEVLRL